MSSLNVALGIVSQSIPVCTSSNKAVADTRVRGKTLTLMAMCFKHAVANMGAQGKEDTLWKI